MPDEEIHHKQPKTTKFRDRDASRLNARESVFSHSNNMNNYKVLTKYQRLFRALLKSKPSFPFITMCDISTIIIAVLQMRKLRLREV